MSHICVSKLTIIGSDNGLSPGGRQAIIWTNAGIMLIGPLRTNFYGTLIKIHTFSFKKMQLKLSFGKWLPFCLSLHVLTHLVLRPEYSAQTRTMLWLQMPWLLVSPRHQQPWCWLHTCKVNGSLSSKRKDFKYLWHLIFCEMIKNANVISYNMYIEKLYIKTRLNKYDTITNYKAELGLEQWN